jgi:hypothetical protein
VITKLAVEGHTDDRGEVAHNVDLSDRRAASVLRWLVEHGIDTVRLTAKGYGPQRPIADNGTLYGRAKNRRVEFHILEPAALAILDPRAAPAAGKGESSLEPAPAGFENPGPQAPAGSTATPAVAPVAPVPPVPPIPPAKVEPAPAAPEPETGPSGKKGKGKKGKKGKAALGDAAAEATAGAAPEAAGGKAKKKGKKGKAAAEDTAAPGSGDEKPATKKRSKKSKPPA